MDERAACALLKARFEAAGFQIEENRPFEEAGVQFEIDGYDPARRVGYEYVTEEAGDGWDVDTAVVGKLADAYQRGLVHVLIVDEKDAPDEAALAAHAEAFLAALPSEPAVATPEAEPAPTDDKATDGVDTEVEATDDIVDGVDTEADPAPAAIEDETESDEAETEVPAAKTRAQPPAAKPAAKRTATTAAKKPAAKKPAAKKPAAKKPAAKKPAAKKPAAKKPAKKSATKPKKR